MLEIMTQIEILKKIFKRQKPSLWVVPLDYRQRQVSAFTI